MIEARFASPLEVGGSPPDSCKPHTSSVYDLSQLPGTAESPPEKRLVQYFLSLLLFHPCVSYVSAILIFSSNMDGKLSSSACCSGFP